jgi:hypothetical protein
MQLSLIILTKQRQQSAVVNYSDTVAKMLSTHITKDLTQVSVPAEDESQQLATFTHALNRVLHFRAHSCP